MQKRVHAGAGHSRTPTVSAATTSVANQIRVRELVQSAGFTMIELLVAMSILVILMAMLSRIYTDSIAAWQLARRRSDMNNAGRAIMNLIYQDLSASGVDDVLHLTMNSQYRETLGSSSHSVAFTALNQVPDTSDSRRHRHAQQLVYFLAPTQEEGQAGYRLMRWRGPNFDKEYFRAYNAISDWMLFPAVDGGPLRQDEYYAETGDNLFDNVRTLKVFVYDRNEKVQLNYDSRTHGPPLWIDVYLELLGEADAQRINVMGAAGIEEADRAVKRFVTRVHFHNRFGYTMDMDN